MGDIPKLFTALAEWLSCITIFLEYYFQIRNNISVKKILTIGVGGVCLACIQLFCGMFDNWLWLLGMALAILVMGAMIKIVLELPIKTAAFETAGTFLKAEFVAALEWQIYAYYSQELGYNNKLVEVLFGTASYLLLFGVCYALEHRTLLVDRVSMEIVSSAKQVVLIWISTLLMFALSNLSYIDIKSPFSGTNANEVFNIRTIVDLAGLFMFEVFHMQIMDFEKRREIDSIKHILKMQYMQYRESQENINLINQKYHDLKHQLMILRNEADGEKRSQYLDEIESGIKKYEAEYKTGNSVLDTILTTKAQQCQKWGIQLNVVADGQLLNDIHVMDICTIFGNALDNAIEYEVQQDEVMHRMVRVCVSKKASFICILVENYYEDEFADAHKFDKTSKKDDKYHGFGIRSIKYSVQKYGGIVKINVLDHWFRVEIMIPDGNMKQNR